ncbi:MAG: family membership [Gammaproteobacteria bacterium]|nr:MAG: family membership [Gammaproteobacteria bacterium]
MRIVRVFGWLSALLLLGSVSVVAFIVVLGWRHPGSLTLPTPTGPYAVGRIVVDWRDDARIDPFAPAGDTKRELPVWIWYPAARDAPQPRAAYMPSRVIEAMQPHPPFLVRFVMERLTIDRASVTAHALDAPALAPGADGFPVLLLKPAVGAAVVQNSALAEDLASHGFVVVGSDSPYTTPGVAYQDGRIALRTLAGHPPESAPGRVSELAPGQPNDLHLPVVDVWVKDNRFILDRLQTLNDADPSGRFTGRLDLNAVGALGHSLGGAAALQFCHEDARCKAGVNLDGMPYGEVVLHGIAKPFLFVSANRPMFDAPMAELSIPERDFLTALERMRQRIPSRPSLLLLQGAAHFNFFDQALLTEPTIWRLFGALGSINPIRALVVARRYVRAFFDTHLKGLPDPLLDGPDDEFPEVHFKS